MGWVAGVQYLQFVEVEAASDKCRASILIQAGALGRLTEQLLSLSDYERAR